MNVIVQHRDVETMSSIRRALEPEGHQIRPVANEQELVTTAAAGDVLILDAGEWMQPAIKSLSGRFPGTLLLLLDRSARGTIANEQTMALADPIDPAELVRVVKLADARSQRKEPQELVDFETLFSGDSPATVELLRQLRLVSQSDSPLTIQGEYGTGRAVVARAVHDRSLRQNQPFVSINAAAFPAQYLEDHLFAGANPLTGRADCTLFIDSLSDLGPAAQAQLLRLVEAGVLNIEGTEIKLDTRVIVADDGAKLRASLANGRLRAELYYQLRVHQLEISPLRARCLDLEPIIVRMLARLATGVARPELSAVALKALEGHAFPGNFRELAHTLKHAMVLAQGGEIDLAHLPIEIQNEHRARTAASHLNTGEIEALDAVAKRFERAYLLRVLRAVGGNRTRAAKMLDLARVCGRS